MIHLFLVKMCHGIFHIHQILTYTNSVSGLAILFMNLALSALQF